MCALWRKTNLFFALAVFALISRALSAITWHLQKDEINVRSDKRERDVHRGVILAYSIEEKNKLCQDFYHAQLYLESNALPKPKEEKEETQMTGREETSEGAQRRTPTIDPRITDDPRKKGDPEHTLIVRQLTTGGKASNEMEIFFTCACKDIKYRKPLDELYFLSSAFRSGWFYVGLPDSKRKNHVNLNRYMGRSPDYQQMELLDVEEKYVNIRKTIAKLKLESPEYMELVRRNDDLLNLSRWQQLILCGSILSSPIYADYMKSVRLQPSKNWIETTKSKLVRFNQKLSFFAGQFHSITMKFDCIRCKGIDDDTDSGTNQCITRSYDDKHSAYVLEYDYNEYAYFVTKYFQNIHVLKNAREPITEGEILINYDRSPSP